MNEDIKYRLLALILFLFSGFVFFTACTQDDTPGFKINPSVKISDTHIQVRNKDEFTWENIEISINNRYSYKIHKLASGHSKSISKSQFSDKKGNRFNRFAVKIKYVDVSSSKGMEFAMERFKVN